MGLEYFKKFSFKLRVKKQEKDSLHIYVYSNDS